MTDRCRECGLDTTSLQPAEVLAAIAATSAKWRTALLDAIDADPEPLLQRPAPEVWAPLEYACHVRDVLAVFAGRVERMLETDGLAMGWWDHEAAAEANAYLRQDPVIVADAIYAAGLGLVAIASRADDADWERTMTRRSGEEFTLIGLLEFGLHEIHHHLLDFVD